MHFPEVTTVAMLLALSLCVLRNCRPSVCPLPCGAHLRSCVHKLAAAVPKQRGKQAQRGEAEGGPQPSLCSPSRLGPAGRQQLPELRKEQGVVGESSLLLPRAASSQRAGQRGCSKAGPVQPLVGVGSHTPVQVPHAWHPPHTHAHGLGHKVLPCCVWVHTLPGVLKA